MQPLHSKEGKSTASNRYGTLGAFYMTPLVLYSAYALKTMPGAGAWVVVTLGLLIATLGTANLLLQLRRWEFSMRSSVSNLVEKKVAQLTPTTGKPKEEPISQQTDKEKIGGSVRETQLIDKDQRICSLSAELNGRDNAMRSLKEEVEVLQQRSQDLDDQVKNSNQQSSHKDTLLRDYQQTIGEQRTIIDKKQQYISRLEVKVQDLTYEVKTLLQLGDLGVSSDYTQVQQPTAEADHPAINVFQATTTENPELDAMMNALPVSSEKKVHTHYDAAVQLQKCIEQAKKLTGASHLGGKSSRFLDLSVDSYAIDLRRLFDSFRNESSCTIILYTSGENRVLFVNNQIKGLLGWSPEKFVKDFTSLIHSSAAEWKHVIRKLEDNSEMQTRLVIKNRSGEAIPIHCYLGKIPTGAFAQHTIGILYSA